jgi:spore coat polysaccharide biosynthesis protein SpsF
MRTVAIIQARMGSTRLPGKVLLPLFDHSVLGHVIRRVQASQTLDDIIIATTNLLPDEAIATEAEKYHAKVYRGSEQDVLSRYYEAALEAQAECVVRITSDCPLIEPEIMDRVVRLREQAKADYASNVLHRSYPRGLDVEVFTMDALARAYHEGAKPDQREHVTPYLYQNPDQFHMASEVNEEDHSQYRWTLDTLEDWELIRRIYGELYTKNPRFSWREALRLMEYMPELAAINQHVEQKKLSE